MFKPGDKVKVNETGEKSVHGCTGIVRLPRSLVNVHVELWNSQGKWIGTRFMPKTWVSSV